MSPGMSQFMTAFALDIDTPAEEVSGNNDAFPGHPCTAETWQCSSHVEIRTNGSGRKAALDQQLFQRARSLNREDHDLVEFQSIQEIIELSTRGPCEVRSDSSSTLISCGSKIACSKSASWFLTHDRSSRSGVGGAAPSAPRNGLSAISLHNKTRWNIPGSPAHMACFVRPTGRDLERRVSGSPRDAINAATR